MFPTSLTTYDVAWQNTARRMAADAPRPRAAAWPLGRRGGRAAAAVRHLAAALAGRLAPAHDSRDWPRGHEHA